MLNSVQRNLRGIFFVAVVGAVAVALVRMPVTAGPPEDASYVGMKKCKACHYKYYKNWSDMKHAQTWQTLPEKYKSDATCIACHATGYGTSSGFVSEEKTPRLTSVQCEACHGPGSAHADAVEADKPEAEFRSLVHRVPQNVCVSCHKPHEPHPEYQK